MTLFLAAIPFLAAAFVWLSPLAFVPVPWPDDSAFYFVARELFKFPPRWVMLPQAPFEPTYRVFNFNTMPLFPILIGIGRFLGIDGSWKLKLWPLLFWASSGSMAIVWLRNRGLSLLPAFALALAFALDPELRWASVLVRPESLVGLFGIGIVLGLTFGFPSRLESRGRYWDPLAALLALGAYVHFNAIFLLFPIVASFAQSPRRLLRIAALTALYLAPYGAMVLSHLGLFVHQMRTQWHRLAVPNHWLTSPRAAIDSLFQSMGSPVPFTPLLSVASALLWILILSAILAVAAYLFPRRIAERSKISLLPAGSFVLGSCWLWHTKPEVWFVYYIHVSVMLFGAIAWMALSIYRKTAIAAIAIPAISLFLYADAKQYFELNADKTWRWGSYESLIDCVDRRLTRLESDLGHPSPFRVWDPTFPDLTVELSRRHPDWEYTRTNDFYDRVPLALAHGHAVEAVVVPESLTWTSRQIDAPASQFPAIQSIWMTWKDYFLHQLYDEPGWKENRHLCQVGRWQAFLFMRSNP